MVLTNDKTYWMQMNPFQLGQYNENIDRGFFLYLKQQNLKQNLKQNLHQLGI